MFLEVTCIRVCTNSFSLQRCHFKHFLLRAFKVEYIDVFLDSAWSNQLYEWQNACLHYLTDDLLSYTLAMVGSNRLQERIGPIHCLFLTNSMVPQEYCSSGRTPRIPFG